MKALRNKRGDAYIYLCVLGIFICLLISVIILYMSITAQVQIQKKDVQAKLDSYVASFAPEGYDALKQGSSKDNYIDWMRLLADTYPALGFDDESDTHFYYENGNCSMTRPQVTVLQGDGFGVTVEYTAIFPVVWNGLNYTNLEIPMTVTSYYKMK